MLDRVPNERKDQAHAHKDRAHQFLTEEYFPEERHDQFIFRIKKVCLASSFCSSFVLAMTWSTG